MSTENKQVAAQQQLPAAFNFFDLQQFEAIQRVATMFANSELVPDMYKISPNNPKEKAIANCTVALEMANRIGASPLAIMQNMVPIYGRPSWSSKFLISTVNTCGRFNPLKFEFKDKGFIGKVEYVEYNTTWENGRKKTSQSKKVFDGTNIPNMSCFAITKAKRDSNDLIGSEIDLIMAVKEGWYLKAGSKWQTMPKQMLMYRAASFWTSVYAPELSMGMKTEDEIRDIHDIDYEDVTDKVQKEVSENANKKVFDFEEAEQIKEEPKVQPKQPEPVEENSNGELFNEGPGF